MPVDFISLAVIALVAALSPILAQLIPGKLIPEVVFLLIAGSILGPHLVNAIQITDSVGLLSDLGLAFLFLLAGHDINPKTLTGNQGRRGFLTWVVCLMLAFLAVALSPVASANHIDGIAVAIALSTTALGTLLPILKERGLMGTRVGESILSYGTWGELCPVFAMALLLSTRAEWKTILILLAFIAIAILVAVVPAKAKKAGYKIFHFLTENANTTSQTMMRVTVLLLVGLVAVSAAFDLDIVLGAFAAGFVLHYIVPEGNDALENKLNGLAYGFLIPIFFVVSGAKIDLMAVFQQPVLLVGFILMLLLIRAVPVFVALSTGKDTRDMSTHNRLSIALYCTTALPIIVAVTAVAVEADAMSQQTASVLVAAGAITVFLMPLLASIAYRVSDTKPLDAVKEISKNPNQAGSILRDHLALERLLSKQDSITKAGLFGRLPSTSHLAVNSLTKNVMENWLSDDHIEKVADFMKDAKLDPTLWNEVKARGDEEWSATKTDGDAAWARLKDEGDQHWSELKKVGDEAVGAQRKDDPQGTTVTLGAKGTSSEDAGKEYAELVRQASAANAADAKRVATLFAAELATRLASLKYSQSDDNTKNPDDDPQK